MSQPQNLPSYIQRPDFQGQQPFFELFFNIINLWFNSSGFYQPSETEAQANTILTMNPIPGTHWLNTTLNAMQFVGADGRLQTLTSFAYGSLNAAQINGMYAIPVQILAAPGSGLAIVVKSLVLELVYGTAPFASGGNVYLQYGATAHGSNYATGATDIPAVFIQGAANAVIESNGTINSTTGLATSVAANAAITITNDTGAFTTGTGCSVNWYLWYSIISVT